MTDHKVTWEEFIRCLKGHGVTYAREQMWKNADTTIGKLTFNGKVVIIPGDYKDDERMPATEVDGYLRRLGIDPSELAFNGSNGAVSVKTPVAGQT